MSVSARKTVFAAVTAAIYAALTTLTAPVSYAALQFRVSEALCVLPFFVPSAAWGLFIGCMIANLPSAAGLPDVVFGSAATLAASLCVAAAGKKARKSAPLNMSGGQLKYRIAACAMPAIFNGPIIGAVLAYSTASPGAFFPAFTVIGAQIAAEETVVMFGLGLPLMRFLSKNVHFSRTANELLK